MRILIRVRGCNHTIISAVKEVSALASVLFMPLSHTHSIHTATLKLSVKEIVTIQIHVVSTIMFTISISVADPLVVVWKGPQSILRGGIRRKSRSEALASTGVSIVDTYFVPDILVAPVFTLPFPGETVTVFTYRKFGGSVSASIREGTALIPIPSRSVAIKSSSEYPNLGIKSIELVVINTNVVRSAVSTSFHGIGPGALKAAGKDKRNQDRGTRTDLQICRI